MTDEQSLPRRRLLSLCGAAGLSALAGCPGLGANEAAETDGDRPGGRATASTETATVVFTDSSSPTADETPTARATPTPTATSSPTPERERVFDGGTLTDFRAALEAASALPDATLQIDPGTYRFDPVQSVPAGDKRAHARIRGIDGVTVEGNDSTFVFTDPLRAGLRFRGGSDLTIRNLTLDYDPVPFTQGEVTGIGDDQRRVTVSLDEGYPSLDDRMFDHADRVWASTHQPDGAFVEGIRGEQDKPIEEISRVGGRRYELSLGAGRDTRGVEIGGRLTVVARNQGTALAFYRVDRPTVENVTAHASGGAVFSSAVCSDPVFRGTTIVPPADSDRQIASDGDGIRVVNCLSSATIEACHHEKLLDDSIVVQHTFTTVTDIRDERTVAVEDVHPFVVGPDDVLEVLSATGVTKGRLPPIADLEARHGVTEARPKPATITFEEPIEDILGVGDHIGNRATGSRNFTVRDNELRNHRGILIRIVARHGTVADNVLDGASRNPIELESDNDRNFAPKGWVSDVTVENNTIRRAGMAYFAGDHPAAIRLHHLPLRELRTEGRPHRNIEILDNDIETTAGVGIDVEAGDGIRIAGNAVSDVNRLDYDNGAFGIALSNVGDVTVENNTVSGASERLRRFGWRKASDDVSLSGNELTVDGEDRSADLLRWAPVTIDCDRQVRPEGSDRHLTIRCFEMRLRAGDEVVESFDVGVDESRLQFGEGYYDPERDADDTWRWFGGESGTTELFFHADALARADTLSVYAKPIESGLEADVTVDERSAGSIQLETETPEWYEIPLPSIDPA